MNLKSSKLSAGHQPTVSAPTTTAKEIFDLLVLDRVVGKTDAVNGAAYKYTIGRDDQTMTAMGAKTAANIGLNTWASFAGTPESAHITDDVAMLETEFNPVIKALRQNNLEVVALHHHMLGESSRIIFLHYY
jgi:hypothetical protein